MIRLVILLIGAICYLFYSGISGIADAQKNKTIQTISFDDFVKNHPGQGWYHLTGCQLDLTDALTHTTNKVRDYILIPVYSANDPAQKSINLLLSSSDPKVYAQLDSLNAALDNKTDAQARQYLIDNHDKVFPVQDLIGETEYSDDTDSETRDKISNIHLNGNLVPNYAILDDGRHPSLGLPILELLGAIALTAGSVVWLVYRNRRPKYTPPPPSYGGYTPPPSGPVPPPSGPMA